MMRRTVAVGMTIGRQAVVFDLFGDQEIFGDLDFLVLGVAREADHLQAVPQGRRDGVQQVRRGQKHHLRQIERHFQVVVRELSVLGRVQGL